MPPGELSLSGIPRPLARARRPSLALQALVAGLLLCPSPQAVQAPSAQVSLPLEPGAARASSAAQEPLGLRVPPARSVNEEEWLHVPVAVEGGQRRLRVFAEGLPPGAWWDEAARTLSFRPDFIQGGQRFDVTFTATDGHATVRAPLRIQVHDTHRPPEPRITRVESLASSVRLVLEQPTDDFLDSPSHAGRSFPARVTVPLTPSAPRSLPVVVRLHGVGSWLPPAWSSDGYLVIEPTDPFLTYWWGYAERLPGAPPREGTVPPYTLRRVLALLEWVLRNHPQADPERVFVEGSSMGGAGALKLGLLHARHFAGVLSLHGQTVARAHRPARRAQLASLWGPPELDLPAPEALGVWSRLDMTRALRDEPEARTQFIIVKHGKDDATIHFGAAVGRSALTGASFHEVLQKERIGHHAAWDEGGHTEPDPWLGKDWWAREWDPRTAPESLLRRDLAFPAFSRSSWDDDPGDGGGNGGQPWRDEEGYAGEARVPGDTGWNGHPAGTRNRGLRWDARRLVDTHERFALPLRAVRGPGVVSLPVVDVTPRRVQRFGCLPGERIRWRFGKATGSVTAARDGSVTVPGLRLGDTWTMLVLEREPPRLPES